MPRCGAQDNAAPHQIAALDRRNFPPIPTLLLKLSSSRVQTMDNTVAAAPYMGFISWIILGLIAGFIGSKIVNKTGEGLILDIVLGIVGAIVGGWLFSLVGSNGVTGLNLWSLLVAVIGAIVVLVVYHAIFGRNRTAY
jgi:uncharacterized membrane protein YeaQ/YmgE (transglycosylase-associated protein family)